MNSRIKELRLALGLNQTDFGKRIGITQSAVAGYEKGIRIPRDSIIYSICREFNVSEEWLRTGEGDMFLSLDDDQEFYDIMASLQIGEDPLVMKILRAYYRLPEEDKAIVQKLIDNLINQNKKNDAQK